jgi:hypothetical protein
MECGAAWLSASLRLKKARRANPGNDESLGWGRFNINSKGDQ